MKIKLVQDNYPKKPGYYLFRGGFSDDAHLIKVEYMDRLDGSIFLGIMSYRKNVQDLCGFFSEKLEFE